MMDGIVEDDDVLETKPRFDALAHVEELPDEASSDEAGAE